jgi:hypothetical protein
MSLRFSQVKTTCVQVSRENGARAICTIGRRATGISAQPTLAEFQIGKAGVSSFDHSIKMKPSLLSLQTIRTGSQ